MTPSERREAACLRSERWRRAQARQDAGLLPDPDDYKPR